MSTKKNAPLALALLALVLGAPGLLAQVDGDLSDAKTAQATMLGSGTVQPGSDFPALLYSKAPVIGRTCVMGVANVSPSSIGYVICSANSGRSYLAPVGALVFIDDATALTLGSFVTDRAGEWSLTADLFVDPAWAGSELMLQAIVYPPPQSEADGPIPYELTNALLWRFGY